MYGRTEICDRSGGVGKDRLRTSRKPRHFVRVGRDKEVKGSDLINEKEKRVRCVRRKKKIMKYVIFIIICSNRKGIC